MTRTQIQLPDLLFHRARAYAAHEEISLAEVVRHALDSFLQSVAPAIDFSKPRSADWTLPSIRGTGLLRDPFDDPDWRYDLHVGNTMPDIGVAEAPARYGPGRKRSKPTP